MYAFCIAVLTFLTQTFVFVINFVNKVSYKEINYKEMVKITHALPITVLRCPISAKYNNKFLHTNQNAQLAEVI